jgi:hypothetical protein
MQRWLGVSHGAGGLMSNWILAQKGDCYVRYYGTMCPNLEEQTEEFKSAVDEFDNYIKRHSKEDDEHGFEDSMPSKISLRSEYMEFDSGFQEDFNQTMNDPKVPAADKGFTLDDFDDAS